MTQPTDDDNNLTPRQTKVLGGFLLCMIILGALAWSIGIVGWMILTWQQVLLWTR